MAYQQRRNVLSAITAIFLVATLAPATANAATSTQAGFAQAKWASNVKVTFGGGKLRFRSNGLPLTGRLAEYAVPDSGAVADPSKAQNYDYSITLSPKKAKKVTPAPMGAIGVMISGGALFNPYEAGGVKVAVTSNFFVTDSKGKKVPFLDSCNGHPTPNGQFHYHGLPSCLTSKIDKAGSPSHIIGIAFDGFPIYGNQGVKGKIITSKELDSCNGITSVTPEFPQGIYHYVLTSEKNSASSIKCFAGTADASLMRMGGMHP